MDKQRGFTVIEMIIAFVVLVTLSVFFVIQRSDLETASRDQTRKTAINAMYYSLTEDYFKDNGSYPRTISRDVLKSVDPTLFTDPTGFTLDGDKCTYTDLDDKQATDGECEYHYKPSDCDGDGKCKAFELSADMEAEGTYTKKSSGNK